MTGISHCCDKPEGSTPINALPVSRKLLLLGVGLTISAVLFGGCGDSIGEPVIDVQGGDAERGRDLIVQYDCGACHTIPGVEDADGLFGPPLTSWSARGYIAGNVNNEPEFLINWIMDPQSIESGTAMPNLGVTRSQARDIAAYLYTLE